MAQKEPSVWGASCRSWEGIKKIFLAPSSCLSTEEPHFYFPMDPKYPQMDIHQLWGKEKTSMIFFRKGPSTSSLGTLCLVASCVFLARPSISFRKDLLGREATRDGVEEASSQGAGCQEEEDHQERAAWHGVHPENTDHFLSSCGLTSSLCTAGISVVFFF